MNARASTNPEYMIDPVVVASFSQTNVMSLKNPHEYVDRYIREDTYEKTLRELSPLKAELVKKCKDDSKAEKEFRDHVKVLYDEKMTERTYGLRWMDILQENLKYPSNTLYINAPAQHRLASQEERDLDDACVRRDLFVLAGFMKPGKQSIRILDSRKGPDGNLVEVCYRKDVLIDHRAVPLFNAAPKDLDAVEAKLALLGARYDAIQAQLEAQKAEPKPTTKKKAPAPKGEAES